MNQDGPMTPEALAALRERFGQQSRKAQAYYALMHEARQVLGNDDAASAWMEAPLPAFEGRTPAQLVAQGGEQALLDHIRSMKKSG